MNKIRLFLLCLIVFWLFGFIYVFLTSGSDRETAKQLKPAAESFDPIIVDDNVRLDFTKLVNDLRVLEEKNAKNEKIISNMKILANRDVKAQPEVANTNSGGFAPSHYFEESRRKLFSDIKDLSFYFNNQISRNDQVFKRIDSDDTRHFKADIQERINLIISQLHNLSASDDMDIWRASASKNLASKIQSKFEALQNPADCQSAKKLICDLNKSCGYGCQIHHIMYCFIVSFFTQRTMILHSQNWRYNHKGFEAYFLPISSTCRDAENEGSVEWNEAFKKGNLDSEKNIRLPIVDSLANRPPYLPLSIPKEYHTEMERFHGDPFVWWAGQVLSFLTRFNDEFKSVIAAKTDKIKFKNSCVGVHVRRTDKVGTEAALHQIEEYMVEVEEYYKLKEVGGAIGQRCVYLATDQLSVLQEAKEKYPNYEFIFDENNAKTASLNERYTPASAEGVILDIYYLSQCEYLVCTFSSQVCRLAYEYMQVRFPDASWRFRSLDDVYYFGGGNGHEVVAIRDHEPRRGTSEIELKKGDVIGLAGNHWNGFSKGNNKRTNKMGLFPSFKVRDIIQLY